MVLFFFFFQGGIIIQINIIYNFDDLKTILKEKQKGFVVKRKQLQRVSSI